MVYQLLSVQVFVWEVYGIHPLYPTMTVQNPPLIRLQIKLQVVILEVATLLRPFHAENMLLPYFFGSERTSQFLIMMARIVQEPWDPGTNVYSFAQF